MRPIRTIAATALALGLLAGCSSGDDPATDDTTLTASTLATAINAAGDGYQCGEVPAGYRCDPPSGAATIFIVGSSDDITSVYGAIPIPESTLTAIADRLGTTTGAIYTRDTGLNWSPAN